MTCTRYSRSAKDDWKEEGFAVYFDVPSLEAERGVQFLGRAFGQASIYKWWGHVWGLHPVDHVTIMQAVVPVASALNQMKVCVRVCACVCACVCVSVSV